MSGWLVDFGRSVTGWADTVPPPPTGIGQFYVSDDGTELLRSVTAQGSFAWSPVVKQQVLDAVAAIKACNGTKDCPTTIHWTTCVKYRGR